MASLDISEFDGEGWSCPICRSERHRVMYDLRKKQTWFSVPGWIVRCADCGMWNKVLGENEDLEDAYGEEYSENFGDDECMENSTTRTFFQSVLKRIDGDGLPDSPRLLDIGAGTGTFMQEAIALGYEAEGIDLTQGFVEVAQKKGLKVRRQNVTELDGDEKYDVIAMMDVIEHVVDPVTILKTMYASLKPGGKLVVFTPNHGSSVVLIARLMEKFGAGFAVEEIFGSNHVCFFDTHTLPAAIEGAGFKTDSVWKFPYNPRRAALNISLPSLAAATVTDWVGYPFGAVFRMVHYAHKPK